MSAFICSDKQFLLAVIGWNHHTKHSYGADRLLEMANTLKRENIRSVNYRYGERTKFEPLAFKEDSFVVDLPPIDQVVQWLRCIDYQSCERDDYEKSKAYTMNMAMQVALLTMMVGDRRFDSTKWTV